MTPADATRTALRGLALPEAERNEKLAKVSPAAREAIEHEIAAIVWLQTLSLFWIDQGTWQEVLDYVEAQVPPGLSVREVSEAAA